MNGLRALIRSTGGSAAAEMALVLPLLIVLMFGTVELGNYFYSEHVLVKGVRDGARYAARQAFSNYTGCTGTVAGTVATDTQTLVRTGALSGGNDLLPKWSDGTTTFTMEIACTPTISGTTLTGVFDGAKNGAGNNVGAPIVTVTASLPYQPIFGYVGGALNLRLNATEQAAVMGL